MGSYDGCYDSGTCLHGYIEPLSIKRRKSNEQNYDTSR